MSKRKRSPDSGGPSKAHLVSFGDTMTALLAFFIVLNSFAKDQTGANLHGGTGSFVRALETLGLPDNYREHRSKNIQQLKHTNALYVVDDPANGTPDTKSRGPDAESNNLRVVDREKDEFDRFIIEMEHLYAVTPLAPIQGEVVFDTFSAFNPQKPILSKQATSTAMQVLPMLRDERYQVELIVWATTPGETAWHRAIDQARQAREEIVGSVRMLPAQQARFHAVGCPWLFSDAKRPILSFVVRKAASQGSENTH